MNRAAVAEVEPETLTADEVRAALKADMARKGLKANAWAERHGFSAPFVSGVLAGSKEPSERVCEVLGIEKRTVVVYSRPGRRR
jgi:hypothetical protein